jgi:hypothetical protein
MLELLGLERCFPRRRFEPDFPPVLWFAGLWFYFKSFLYLCYVYMEGLEPGPYSAVVKVETIYFLCAAIPCFLFGMALWREKKHIVKPATIFVAIDTPVVIFHVFRMANAGMLDSGLSGALEAGSLGLNLLSLGWLTSYLMMEEKQGVRK